PCAALRRRRPDSVDLYCWSAIVVRQPGDGVWYAQFWWTHLRNCRTEIIPPPPSSKASVMIFITASAPTKGSLGATNGLAQMSVSVSRAFGPGMATSLFSFSAECNLLGGYAVYVI